MAKVITALLDLSVSRLAETMDVLRVTYTTRSGRPVKVLEMKQRRAVPADQKWRQMQMEALPTIGGLCREGRLSLCGSTELSLEAMKGTYRGGNVIGDLLGGVKLVHVPCAIDRSKFQQMNLEEYVEKTTVVEFCKLLLRLDSSALAESSWLIERFTDSEVTNLRNLERFRTLCATLDESQYPDAFHLWTAEVNGLDYFLTADRAFINVMTKTARVQLKTKPVAPRDLLDDLGIPGSDRVPVIVE